MNSCSPGSAGKIRFDHLDGLRGIAAFSVMVGHIRWPSSLATLPPFHTVSLWVDFFFVLSGFVIAHTYFERLAGGLPVASFMARRFARLYPLHLLMLLAAVAYEVVKWKLFSSVEVGANHAPFENNNPASFAANLFLVHSLGLFPDVTWNGPSWSISVEFYTYLTFAILLAIARTRKAIFWTALIALQIVSLIVLATRTNGAYLSVETDFGFLRCVLGFGLGVIVQRIHAARACVGNADAGSKDGIKALLAAAILLLIALPTYKTPITLVAPFLFAVFLWVMVRYRGGILEKILLSRACQFLGMLSYSIYMTHSVFRIGLRNVWKFGQGFEPLRSGWGATLLAEGLTLFYIAIVLLVSWGCYRLVEMPCQRWLNRFFDRPAREVPDADRPAPARA